jgi:hypothetical protein
MDIIVSFQQKWGKRLFYPESDDAKFLAEFSGTPTLLLRQLHMAINRGWKVKVIEKPFDLPGYLNNIIEKCDES